MVSGYKNKRTAGDADHAAAMKPRDRTMAKQGARATGTPVERDKERFKLLFTNHMPILPEGHSAPLCLKTTRELAGERIRALKTAAQAK